MVTFGSRARCQTLNSTFNGSEVERVQSCKYLGFEIHATKALTYGVSKLVSAANKAMHAMRCTYFHVHDPKQGCKLSDSLVLPILNYAGEVWAVDQEVGESAEQLHRQFLKHWT